MITDLLDRLQTALALPSSARRLDASELAAFLDDLGVERAQRHVGLLLPLLMDDLPLAFVKAEILAADGVHARLH
ncbi:hypothetical protein [Deinococcus yavapaiensis]|uniref:Uncharacterized protein n=1 Tax=Deinococcus yavapaiensis KR-236 TaxID=694435 RepID=A0A318S1J7_9DEIO|nr:hypothetical protein [Deinococcus yavapaiensis]PYE48343.1 hypothetical protein DES52_13113 [Deinococcus yavapaiensis KR-236]